MHAGSANQTFRSAVEHHQGGRLAQAEALYRQALAENPHDGDALHLMGVLTYQQGRLQLARDLIRRAIAIHPDAAPYHRNLGLVLTAQEKLPEAVAAFEAALKLNPEFAEAYANLGYVLLQQNRKSEAINAIARGAELRPQAMEIAGLHARLLLEEKKVEDAIHVFKRMLTHRPDQPDIWNELGIAHKQNRKPTEAILAWRQALARKPDFPAAMSNLAVALLAENQFDESIDLSRRLISQTPEEAAPHLTLGSALLQKGDPTAALAPLRKATELQPNSTEAHAGLAEAQLAAGDREAAATTLQGAVDLNPNSAALRLNLGEIELSLDRHNAAIENLETATKLDAISATALTTLARAHFEVGEIEQASDSLERALELDPSNLALRSQWIYTLHYHPDADPNTLIDEARKWDSTRAQRDFNRTPKPPTTQGSSTRFLRVGFLIPPFADDQVLLKLFPLFRRHNHEQFHFYVYSDQPESTERSATLQPSPLLPPSPGPQLVSAGWVGANSNDVPLSPQPEVTPAPYPSADILKRLSREWRNTANLSHAELASQIRQDNIDILIDLAQHAPGNRLTTLAANPARLQLTFGFYPGTTGLAAIQYRLTDSHLETPAPLQTTPEKPIHLPNSYYCWDPDSLAEEFHQSPTPLPASTNGYPTFGAFAPAPKLNDELLDSWAQILRATPNSRLLLPALPSRTRNRALKIFHEQKVAPDRIEFTPAQSLTDFAHLMSRLDLLLDTHPFSASSSTLMALWLGIPAISQFSQTPVSRIGLTLLSNLDLKSLTADSRDRYIQLATELSQDHPHLSDLRSTLRQRMIQSPLTDARRFTRNFEALLQDLWETTQPT
jgi:protein O-GlcNAc transferase